MNGDVFCGTGRSKAGRPLSTGLAAAGVGGAGEIEEVSVAVSAWVEQVGRFLGVVQAALEQSRPSDDATAEVRAVAGQLPALIRQCRAQVPTPEMIHTWVQTLTESRVRDGINAGDRRDRSMGCDAGGVAAFGLPRQGRSFDPA
jgi:hypothetical protein